MDFDWKATIRTVAPTIANFFGGPLAGLAVRKASEAVLGKPGGTEEEIEKALLTAGPETYARLRESDNEFKIEIKKLGVREAKIHAGDRASARARHAQMKDQMPAIIGLASIIDFFGVLAALIFVDVPESGKAPLQVMLGALGGLVLQVGNYYFGSSAGSESKNKVIAGVLGKAA